MGKKGSKMTKTKDHLIVVCRSSCICVKDIIYRFLSFFQKFYFSVISGVKRLKMVQNDRKLCAPISGTIDHMIVICGTHVEIDNISGYFLVFSKIVIFWVLTEVKGQKTVQSNKKFCPFCSIS